MERQFETDLTVSTSVVANEMNLVNAVSAEYSLVFTSSLPVFMTVPLVFAPNVPIPGMSHCRKVHDRTLRCMGG